MSFTLLEANLGVDKDSSGYSETFFVSESVTSELSKFLSEEKVIKIDCSRLSFDNKKLFFDGFIKLEKKYIFGKDQKERTKLVIKLKNEEDASTLTFVCIREFGWAVKNKNGDIVEKSTDKNNILAISLESAKGYKSISSGAKAEEIAKDVAKMFGAGDVAATAAGKLAGRAASSASETFGDLEDIVKGKVPFGFSESTIEYDNGVGRDEPTRLFQRCLIRLAGGNLYSERRHLRDDDYPVSTNLWKSGKGPIVGIMVSNPKKNYADDGRFGPKTLEALLALKPTIDSIEAGLISKDGTIVKASIITSKVCQGRTGDVTAEERKNSEAKQPMAPTSVPSSTEPEKTRKKVVTIGSIDKPLSRPEFSKFEAEQKPNLPEDTLTDVYFMENDNNLNIAHYDGPIFKGSTTAVPASVKPIPPAPPQPPKTKTLYNYKAENSYKVLQLAANGDPNLKTKANPKLQTKLNNIDTACDGWLNSYSQDRTEKNKKRILKQIQVYRAQLRSETNWFSEQDFENNSIKFLNDFEYGISVIPTAEEHDDEAVNESKSNNKKILKETKKPVYTEFSFLSAKNSRLHSVLMEQLKKDLRRG